MKRRFITRRVPGFNWVQLVITGKWQWGHWWAVRGFARTHAFGFVRILTMRSDAIERGRRSGVWEHRDL